MKYRRRRIPNARQTSCSSRKVSVRALGHRNRAIESCVWGLGALCGAGCDCSSHLKHELLEAVYISIDLRNRLHQRRELQQLVLVLQRQETRAIQVVSSILSTRRLIHLRDGTPGAPQSHCMHPRCEIVDWILPVVVLVEEGEGGRLWSRTESGATFRTIIARSHTFHLRRLMVARIATRVDKWRSPRWDA